MDFREGLRTRRSVRQYIPNRDIPADDIRDILETAMLAPSGRNKQPWEFIVVNDKSKFPEITQAQPYCRFLEEASLAVIVCGNTEEEMAPGAWMVDCAAATRKRRWLPALGWLIVPRQPKICCWLAMPKNLAAAGAEFIRTKSAWKTLFVCLICRRILSRCLWWLSATRRRNRGSRKIALNSRKSI